MQPAALDAIDGPVDLLVDPRRTSAESFAPGVAERIGFYVYLLIDPRDDVVFYVGKGTGNRCFAHLEEARKTLADSVGDYPKLARIRAVEAAGHVVRVDILRHGLNEPEAFLVESTAIDLADLLGQWNLDNRVVGHGASILGRMSVTDVNARYGASPVTIEREHRVALIRINRQFERGMSETELYEATRKWWRVGARARDVGTPWAPAWAFAVFGGIVRAVFRIEGWEPVTNDVVAGDARLAGRWAFRGTRDPDLEAVYLFGDVSGYLGVSQNPVRYINCGTQDAA